MVAEPPPETTKIQLGHPPSFCLAPLYVAAELLPGKGFTEVQSIKTGRELLARAVCRPAWRPLAEQPLGGRHTARSRQRLL